MSENTGAKRKGFQPGNPGGPGRGHKKPRPQFGFDPIADLLYVYRTPPGQKETPGQRAARKLLETDHKTFMQLLLRAGDLSLTAGDLSQPGEKEERVEELAERLLREWEVQNGSGFRAEAALPSG